MRILRFSRFVLTTVGLVVSAWACSQQIFFTNVGGTSEPASISMRPSVEVTRHQTPGDRVVRKKPGRTTYANITLERGWNPDCLAAVNLVNDVLLRTFDRRSGSIIIIDQDGESRTLLSGIKSVEVVFPSAGSLRRPEDPHQVSISFLALADHMNRLPASLVVHREQAARAALAQSRNLAASVVNPEGSPARLTVTGFGGLTATERPNVSDAELLDFTNMKLEHGLQDRAYLEAWEADVKAAGAGLAAEPFRDLVVTYSVGSRYKTHLHLRCFPISRVDGRNSSIVEYTVESARLEVEPLTP
jgi:hypothetical protein